MHLRAKVTHDGGLDVRLELGALDLVAFGKILTDLQREVTAAARAQAAMERMHAIEDQEAEKRREEFYKACRLALSIYRRTGSPRLAAKATGILATDVRDLVKECRRRERANQAEARRQLVGRLHAKGVPVEKIARRARVHVKSVPRIARAARQAQLPLEGAEVFHVG